MDAPSIGLEVHLTHVQGDLTQKKLLAIMIIFGACYVHLPG